MSGAGRLQLVGEPHEPGRFISFGAWESIGHVPTRKSSPGFREWMVQVTQHVEEFDPIPLALVTTPQAGATKTVALVGTT
jgi:quinol monooxygenase YgiN